MKLRHDDPVKVVAEGMNAALRGETIHDDAERGASLMRALRQVQQSPTAQRKLGLMCMNILVLHHQAQVDRARSAQGTSK